MLQRGVKINITERRIFKTLAFCKLSNELHIDDRTLIQAVKEMENGNFEANLGGNCIKKRIPLEGRGKSGGARTIVAVNIKGLWFFMYVYPKNERDNIDKKELLQFKKLSKIMLNLTEEQIATQIQNGNLSEVIVK